MDRSDRGGGTAASPASVLRGREAELEAVTAALAELEGGRGGTLVLEGPPGIGRSALLRAACGQAGRAGARVQVGEAFESRQAVPYAPLLEALSTGGRPVVDADVARGLDGTSDGRYWLVHDLHAAVETAACRSPLVIAIDDLQWADNATSSALRWLVPGLAQLPVLWLLTARSGRRRRAVRELLTGLDRGSALRLHLGALAGDAVDEVVRDHVGARPGATLSALLQEAQGNPFLLVELLRGLREERRLRTVDGRVEVVDAGLPRRITTTMPDRLAELSPEAGQLVRVAAALPPRFAAAQLAAVLRLPPSTLVPPLQEALDADLLRETGEQLGFRHDLIRRAVLEAMPRSLRRALQRDAVAVLLAAGTPPAEVALQLADSAEKGDREAVTTLREAARHVARSDAVAAADLSVRALDLLPTGDPDRGALTAETVTLLHRARRSDRAVALADSVLAVVLPAREEADVRLSLSAMMTRPTLARIAENRRALTLPGLAPLVRGRHLAWLAYNLAVGGEPQPAVAAARSALREAELAADTETRVVAGLALATADAAGADFTRALARLDDLARSARSHDRAVFTALLGFHRACMLAVLDRIDEARAVVVEGVVSARAERDVLLLASWTQFGGMLRLAAGQLSEARAEAAWNTPADDEPAADTFAGVMRMTASCHVGAHAGDTVSLRAGRAAARRAGAGSSPAVRDLATRLLACTASGPDAAADAARLLVDDPLVPATPLVPCDYGYQPRVARIARNAGDVGLAERAAAVTERVAGRNPGVPLFAGLAAQTRGLVDDDPALLVEAAQLLQGTQRPLVAASAAEDAGRALTERGRGREAVQQLQGAFDLYAALGATADARRVARLLRRHGVRRRVSADRPGTGWASLTASELQVVRLIAAGATNRAAAEQLYLSPHTVNSHLRSAFSKLGINSRVQLARVLAEVEP